MIHYIEQNQINTELNKSKKIVLIEFCISNSVVCQTQNNILREIEKNYYDKIDVFKVEIDETQDVKVSYNISSTPTILFYQNGVELERIVGFTEKEKILEIINDLDN